MRPAAPRSAVRRVRAALVGLVAAGAIAGAASPAGAQYFFLDTNGDGTSRCVDPAAPADRLTPGVTSVDVYLVTDRGIDGSKVTCSVYEGSYIPPLSFYSFEFVLRTWGEGTVQYEAWTDAVGFPNGLIPLDDFTMAARGSDVWVGRFTVYPLGPGKYRMGTLAVKVTGYPRLDFAITTPMGNPGAETYFGSLCMSARMDNARRLGVDFFDACGTAAPADPAELAVWDRIQGLYR